MTLAVVVCWVLSLLIALCVGFAVGVQYEGIGDAGTLRERERGER